MESGTTDDNYYVGDVYMFGSEWDLELKMVNFLLCHNVELSCSCSMTMHENVKI